MSTAHRAAVDELELGVAVSIKTTVNDIVHQQAGRPALVGLHDNVSCSGEVKEHVWSWATAGINAKPASVIALEGSRATRR